jgi:hypothetical protein
LRPEKTRNHGFIDGNKRTAYVITRLFLVLNGYDIFASASGKVLVFERVGNGVCSQETLAFWLRDPLRTVPLKLICQFARKAFAGVFRDFPARGLQNLPGASIHPSGEPHVLEYFLT